MPKRLKVIEVNGEEVLIEEEFELEKVEFRVYYDDNGNVLFYSCEKPAGNYLVIDKQTYAEMRFDFKVIDGKLVKYIPGVIISKLKPHKTEGVFCAKEDISVLVNKSFSDKQKWKLNTYELK